VLSVMLIGTAAFANANVRLDALVTPPAATEIVANDPLAVSRVVIQDFGSPAVTTTGVGEAAADLRSGTLRMSFLGSIFNGQGSLPSGTASLFDVITVTGPGPNVLVTAVLTVDGIFTFQNGGNNLQTQGIASAGVSIGSGQGLANASVTGDWIVTRTPDLPTSDVTIFNRTGPGISTSGSGGQMLFTLTATETIPVGTPTNVSSFLQIQGGCAAICDGVGGSGSFGNTARLAITLPADYAFTSSSGALLSMAGAPGLPLPDAGDLVGIGGDGGAPIPGSDGGAADAGTTPDAGAADAGPTPDAGAPSQHSSGGCGIAGGSAPTAPGLLAAFAALALYLRSRRRRTCR
jgi:MYXO-CTERM domain-containing protein